MVNNQEQALQIKEILLTLLEAEKEAKKCLQQNEILFSTLISEMEQLLFLVYQISKKQTEVPYQKLAIGCENSLVSLKRLEIYAKNGQGKLAEQKLEYEYLPMIRIAYTNFYYSAIVEGNDELEDYFWKQEVFDLTQNYYIEKSIQTGIYKYDVTVIVIAYNHLDYTQMCVGQILKNMPQDLRVELILVNHGSDDGTKEYFEWVCPNKQVDIKKNCTDGFIIPFFITEGKYAIVVSNDVLLSKNAIELMYECMEEDKQIAYVVPTTPAISNLQSLLDKEVVYNNIEEFDKVAEDYNVRNIRKEECRIRLLNPICGIQMGAYTNDKNSLAFANAMLKMKSPMFGDDLLSLLFRRAGYKNVLMKDVLCHHIGSVTVGKQHNYLEGRKTFFQIYGVDPWEKGVCYFLPLFQKLICNKIDATHVLGINAGIGGNPLKIKEELKAHTGNAFVKLINYTMEPRFLSDLKGISDEADYVPSWGILRQKIVDQYDYIMVCGGLENQANYNKELEYLYEHVKEKGVLIFQTALKKQAEWFQKRFPNTGEILEGEEHIFLQPVELMQYFVYAIK